MNTKFFMDDYCFACGRKNEHGLRLNIIDANEGVQAVIKLPLWTQGYNKITHGGIIATVLDEMAVWAAYKKGYISVTAELSVRIKKALKVDDDYIAKGKVVTVKHRLIQAKSEVVNKNEEIMAIANVKLIRID